MLVRGWLRSFGAATFYPEKPMSCKKYDFEPPKGSVPEGTKPGDTFDLVTTYKLNDDGTVCLTQMGDMKMDADEGKPEKPKTRQYQAEASDMVSSMKGQ